MNIVIVTESGVETFKRWTEVKKHTSFKKEDFSQIGVDYLLNCTDDTYTMSLDIKQLETVASQKVFTKDKFDLTNWLQVLVLVVVFFMR